jgi:glycosyltransferase involved in cell wall biosynthesis
MASRILIVSPTTSLCGAGWFRHELAMALHWIGDGSLRSQLEEALDRYGIADHVRLLGYQWEVAPLYDGADVMVLTSLSEGMPLAVMEAMAKGLPPICTDVGGTAEAIADAGIVLPAPAPDGRTAAGLTTALERLSADSAARDRLASRARQRAAALFRQDRMTEEYLDLIAHGLASPPSTEPFVARLDRAEESETLVEGRGYPAFRIAITASVQNGLAASSSSGLSNGWYRP